MTNNLGGIGSDLNMQPSQMVCLHPKNITVGSICQLHLQLQLQFVLK